MWWVAITFAVLLVGMWVALTVAADQPLRVLSRLNCPVCGATFGEALARESKQRYSKQCQTEREKIEARVGPALVDFDGIWSVACQNCKGQFGYESTKQKLCDSETAS